MTEPTGTAPPPFRSAKLSILASYVSHAVSILLGGLGVTFIVQLLPTDWHWLAPALIALLVATMVIQPLWSYWFTRYTVTSEALVEESGWLDRRVRTMQWSTVQAIDRRTEWELRLFGLAHLQVAQTGQDEARIEIRGIRAATVEHVLELARAGRGALPLHDALAATDEPRPGQTLYRATIGDLVVMSVMFGAAIFAAPAMAFGAWEMAEQFGLQGWFQELVARLQPVTAAIIAAVIAIAISILRTVLAHFGFTVSREGEELRIRQGLLITKERVFRESSIQGVVVQRNLLEQCTGRARLWLLTLDGDDHLGQNLVLPSLPIRVVERVAREAFPSRVPISGSLLAARPPVVTALLTTLLALGVLGGVYAACTIRLGWHPAFAGAAALIALATVSAIFRVLLARFEVDRRGELLLLRRSYLTESLRAVDLTSVRRVSARRVPHWLARGTLLLPSAAIYAGKGTTLRALRADASAVELVRATSVAHAPAAAAAVLAQHRV